MRHAQTRSALRSAVVLAALAVFAVVPNFAGAGGPVQTARVTVDLNGHGTGHVTIKVDGDPPVECPNSCLFTVPVGTQVSFVATAVAGSYFAGFGEPCAGTPEACGLTISSATRFAATFQLKPTVTVGLQGVGSGTVKATTGSGSTASVLFTCPAVCSAQVMPGTNVVLTPTAAAGSSFAGWNGEPCAGTPEACGVAAVQKSLKVSAIFRKADSTTSLGW